MMHNEESTFFSSWIIIQPLFGMFKSSLCGLCFSGHWIAEVFPREVDETPCLRVSQGPSI